jgi:NADPH:quinone reductase-like Zn-dependent oxidoreductase
MRAIVIEKFGRPETLILRELPDPEPGPGEVRVRVRAAGLNFAEVMARKGMYPDAPPTPLVAGYELAGEIEALGSGVKQRVIGERVLAMIRFGAHAEKCVVAEEQVFPIPAAMSFEQGAALPVNYLTAYQMLHRTFRIAAGDTVLIHMAAGGVGTAALQLCAASNGVTTIGTASAGKHEYVRKHGCDHVIDYRSLDYVSEVRRITQDRGVELVLDALGGRDWKKGYSLLRAGGMLIAFGWANMSSGESRSLIKMLTEGVHLPFYTPLGLMNENRSVSGVNMGRMWHERERLNAAMGALMQLFSEGKILPHVDRSFGFSEAADAHRYLESGKSVGKVVLVP